MHSILAAIISPGGAGRIALDGDGGGSGGGSGRDDARQGRGYNTDYSSHSGWRGANYGNNGQGDNNAPTGTDNDSSVNNAPSQSDEQAAENRGVQSGKMSPKTGSGWVDNNLSMDIGRESSLMEKLGSFIPGLDFSHEENPATMAEGPTQIGVNPGELVGMATGVPFAGTVLGYAADKAGLTYGPQNASMIDGAVSKFGGIALSGADPNASYPGGTQNGNNQSPSRGLLSGVTNNGTSTASGGSDTPSNSSNVDLVSNAAGEGLPTPGERFRSDRYLGGRWARNAETGQLEWVASA